MTMISHKICNNDHTSLMNFFHQFLHISFCSEMRVNLFKVHYMIAMISGSLIERSQHNSRHTKPLNIIKMLDYTPDATAFEVTIGIFISYGKEAVYQYMIYPFLLHLQKSSFVRRISFKSE